MKQTRRPNRNQSSQEQEDFSQAVNRFESAVQELVSATAGELSDRVTNLINDTTTRLESELRVKRMAADDVDAEENLSRRQRRRSQRHRFQDSSGTSSRLTRDLERSKIAGVCAGLARHFGIETWIVRLAALTGLLFMAHIVFPAYWITWFIMKNNGSDEMEYAQSEPVGRRSKGRKRKRKSRRSEPFGDEEFNARRNLGYARTDLTQAELRLRRLESFVTSGQYELHRELNRIEREA